MPREEVIVERILKWINAQEEGVAEKVQGSAISSGKADINACYKGHSIRIEVKSKDHNNKASKKQILNIQRWRSAGAYCIVAYDLTDVKNLLWKIDADESLHTYLTHKDSR